MSAKPAPKKTRGRPVKLEGWWLLAANRAAEGWTLQGLAAALTDVAKRNPPWDRTTVGDFLQNLHPTYELMDAFRELFDLPSQEYVARSYEEADQLRKVARRYDPVNPEKAKRLAELDKAREHLAKAAQDHTDRLDSADAQGTRNRRRPRGVVGSRAASS